MRDKELKEIRKTMFEQIENVNKETNYRKEPEILELKSTVAKMKNLPAGFDSTFQQTEVRIILNLDN